jgi:hypothetical protein
VLADSRRFFDLACGLLVFVASLAPGRRSAAAATAQQALLQRPVAVAQGTLSVDSAFQSVMLASGAPGGETLLTGCQQEGKALVHLRGNTLEQGLDAITRADPRYRWRVADGVINLLPAGEPPALLMARVSYFDSGPATDIVSAGAFLFALPEVWQAEASLGLRRSAFFGRTLGSMLPGPQPPRKRLGLRLRDVTVLAALNAIVRVNTRGVWTYSETNCQGIRTFDLTLSQ